jgi:biopolymer transport protein ExbD
MASPMSQGNNGIISGINVTPLVDITLVLLVIFMVTTTIVSAPAIPMELPRASQTEEVQVVFSIVLPSAGAARVNGEVVTSDDAFSRMAQDAARRDPHLRAVIQADGAVPHRRVIHTLDLLKTAGVAKVAFGALPPDERAP